MKALISILLYSASIFLGSVILTLALNALLASFGSDASIQLVQGLLIVITARSLFWSVRS